MRNVRAALLSLAICGSAVLGVAVAQPSSSAPAPDSKTTSAKSSTSEGTPAVIVDDDKVESLLGKIVTSSAGDKLGQITDVLVGHAGDLRAAVVDFGGFLGVGTRKVAVAWTALKFSQDTITLAMTRDELRVTPEYREKEPIVIVGAANPQAASSNAAKSKTAN